MTLPPSLERFGDRLEAAIDHQLDSGGSGHAATVRAPGGARRVAMVGFATLALVAGVSLAGAFANGAFVARAAAAQAAAALENVPANAIMHTHTIGRQDNGDGTTVSWEDESWRQTSAPFAGRMVEHGPDGPVAESAVDRQGHGLLYDAATNTIYQGPSTDAAQIASADEGFRSQALDMLNSGQAVEDGHETVLGRDAIRIVSKDGHEVYLVDAATYDPLEWRTTGTGGVTLTFGAYEVLPASAANLALLDLAEQHPGAATDTDPAHYQDALGRLYPHG